MTKVAGYECDTCDKFVKGLTLPASWFQVKYGPDRGDRDDERGWHFDTVECLRKWSTA